MVNADVTADGLFTEAFPLIIVAAPHLARLLPLPAKVATRAPLTSSPLVTTRVVGANFLCGRLRRERAFMILARTAHDLPSPNRLAAEVSALSPAKRNPMGALSVELTLNGERRRQGRQLVILRASFRFLAHQSALRLRADFGIAAIPGTTRRMAYVLTRDMIRTLQVAHGSGTTSLAFGRRAIRPLLRLASILRAEN